MLADSFATPEPRFKSQPSNALASIVPTALAASSFSTVASSKTDKGGIESAPDFYNFVKEQIEKYQYRVNAINQDTIPDIYQYELRSEIFHRMGLLQSASSLVEKEQINLVLDKDAEGKVLPMFALASLKTNARYSLVENYREGFARIRKNQVYGFLNLNGEEAIPSQYEQAEPFNDGKALVKRTDWFFVNTKGEEGNVLPTIVEAKALKWGFSLVKVKDTEKGQLKYAIIDNTYEATQKPVSELYDAIEPFHNELFVVRNGKKIGLIRINGRVRLDVELDKIEVTNIPGLYRIEMLKKVGYIDTLGVMKVPVSYDEIKPFNQFGLAVARLSEGYQLIHYPDFKRSIVYKSISDFDENGLAIIQNLQSLFGMISKDFVETIPPTFFSLSPFNELGLASACMQAGKCGFINRKGDSVLPFDFEVVGKYSRHGLVVVRGANKDCACVADMVYDFQGRMIVPPDESGIDKIRYQVSDTLMAGGYVVIKVLNFDKQNRSAYHLIFKQSLKKITPMAFEAIVDFDENQLFRVKKDGRWGLMDTAGMVVAKCQYKDVMVSSEGLYPVRSDNNKFGFIDKKGKLQVTFDYDEVKNFKGGVAIVSKGPNKIGLVNRYNAKIAPCEFTGIQFEEENKIALSSPTGEKFYLNNQGDCLDNCEKFAEILKKANQGM